MKNYWSCTDFADKIRAVFGIKPQPKSASHEGWNEYMATSIQTSRFGYSIVEGLDNLQDVVFFIPNMLRDISYKCSNYLNNNHMLRTKTSPGNWADLSTRIPDALLLSVVDFIEKECFWSDIVFVNAKTENMSELVWRYKNQSYIRRKLFPIKISDGERAKHGIAYLNFQIENDINPEQTADQHPYVKIIAAYNFAKFEYDRDLYMESGYHDAIKIASSKKSDMFTVAECSAYKKLREMEQKLADDTVLHCMNIVKYHEYLST